MSRVGWVCGSVVREVPNIANTWRSGALRSLNPHRYIFGSNSHDLWEPGRSRRIPWKFFRPVRFQFRVPENPSSFYFFFLLFRPWLLTDGVHLRSTAQSNLSNSKKKYIFIVWSKNMINDFKLYRVSYSLFSSDPKPKQ